MMACGLDGGLDREADGINEALLGLFKGTTDGINVGSLDGNDDRSVEVRRDGMLLNTLEGIKLDMVDGSKDGLRD